MHPRVRAASLAAAALMALVPPAGAAAQSAPGAASQALTWSIVPSPNRNVLGNGITGISCPSASACTAVGFYQGRTLVGKTLIESWNGTAWSIVPSPSRPSHNYLRSVSCPSVHACTAVGYSYGAHSQPKTLIESWNGTSWSIVPSPNPGSALGQDELDGVSCPTASACTAVGFHYRTHTKTLVESWNGTAWSVVPTPSTARTSDDNYFTGVSCLSATACTAVGSHNGRTLVETWNGASWSVVPSPNAAGSGGNTLTSVSCAAADACTAVGAWGPPTGGATSTLAEAWNGTTWSIVPSPNAGRDLNGLTGVSCVAAGECNAVGYYNNTPTGPARTLAEAWDGTAWSIVPSPNVPGTNISSVLAGVSCASGSLCMAAGGTGKNSSSSFEDKTLTELGTSSG